MDRKRLAQAFDEWKRRYEADPSQFAAMSSGNYGDDCAEYLLQLLAEKL